MGEGKLFTARGSLILSAIACLQGQINCYIGLWTNVIGSVLKSLT